MNHISKVYQPDFEEFKKQTGYKMYLLGLILKMQFIALIGLIIIYMGSL